jgi:3-phenylpropionate/trans-cinnamate dioxygenase ferredoxin reductase subunit
MTTQDAVVIVGAGHAGGTAAALLRQYGFTGPIVLVGTEKRMPYQRPPLSKALLLGKSTEAELNLKPDTFYAERNIEVRLGQTVASIDRAGKAVTLADGSRIPYGHLVLATGARLRDLPVPGIELAGVMSLRTTDDSLKLRASIREGTHVVIVGGGYIGLEAAASARLLGAHVTVIEREKRLLARVASEPLAAFVADYARAKGVELVLGDTVESFQGEGGHVKQVALRSGKSIPCDVALVGIGVLAEQGLAEAAGLACRDGVLVDDTARTSDPDISAIGDCTRRPVRLFEGLTRLESVHNAVEQSKQMAARLCGKPAPTQDAPWTWSDQFDLRLQLAGLIGPDDRIVVRGQMGGKSFAVFHVSPKGVIRAVEAVNAPMDFSFARMAIARELHTPLERLADTAVALKDIAAAG